jgi:toxin ParE1/3/4
MNVTFSLDAAEELEIAALFYADNADGLLSAAFIAEAERIINVIVANPSIGIRLRGDLRRLGFNRFPYTVIYRRLGDDVRVLAVAHQRRRPGYWARRS